MNFVPRLDLYFSPSEMTEVNEMNARMSEAALELGSRVRKFLETSIVRAVEKHLGRVPSDYEAGQHGRIVEIIPRGESPYESMYEIYWKDQIIDIVSICSTLYANGPDSNPDHAGSDTP